MVSIPITPDWPICSNVSPRRGSRRLGQFRSRGFDVRMGSNWAAVCRTAPEVLNSRVMPLRVHFLVVISMRCHSSVLFFADKYLFVVVAQSLSSHTTSTDDDDSGRGQAADRNCFGKLLWWHSDNSTDDAQKNWLRFVELPCNGVVTLPKTPIHPSKPSKFLFFSCSVTSTLSVDSFTPGIVIRRDQCG